MLQLVEKDPYLKPYEKAIDGRYQYAMQKLQNLTTGHLGHLSDLASGYLYFGMHRTDQGWVFREWAPNAKGITLVGDFSNWEVKSEYRMTPLDNGQWEIKIPLATISHGTHYKLFVEWEGGHDYRIPAWADYVVQDKDTHLFSAVVWSPQQPYTFEHDRPTLNDRPLLIYECHIGMATESEGIGTYRDFKEKILPRVIQKGYNAIQVMAIMEHPYYGSFGYQVSSFFAPSSRYGTPDELKELVDEAHKHGILVIMDLVHSHAVKNEAEGLARFDGTYTQYFHSGDRMRHPAWDSMCFDYGKDEVLHFLLSNCKYWLDVFHFDGFRFDGVTSMLYYSHGLGQAFTSYHDYYDGTQDGDAIMYLTLANKLIHEVYPQAITIAEDVSGMPGLALPVEDGGYGFDYRLAMNIPDFWIKLIKESPDENWTPGSIWWECTNRRVSEKTISYVESHDQALVGDKTVIFRMMDQEMYWHMNKDDQHPTITRGIALHKMIRLVTLTTINGGYLCFMGNEFGHPEWIDFPREGNNWSYKYARRQWSLVDNGFLRYGQLEAFDNAMISYVTSIPNFENLPIRQLWDQKEDQVLAYMRGQDIYVFNFNPTVSHVDYKILAPGGEYEVILNSDHPDFGGYGLSDDTTRHFTMPDNRYTIEGMGWLSLYLPARSCMILRQA